MMILTEQESQGLIEDLADLVCQEDGYIYEIEGRIVTRLIAEIITGDVEGSE